MLVRTLSVRYLEYELMHMCSQLKQEQRVGGIKLFYIRVLLSLSFLMVPYM